MYKDINTCLCCGGDTLYTVKDFGSMPLANTYDVHSKFPLELLMCFVCQHLQLSIEVSPNILYSRYYYRSGTSITLREYFKWFANMVYSATECKEVLDIACNDGSQLTEFKNLGVKTYGIDPSINISNIARKAGHVVFTEFLDGNCYLIKQGKKFDAISAQNVLGHTGNPLAFLQTCKSLLTDTGKAYIQVSQADFVNTGQYDTIYHEHISYFSISSFKTLANRAGLMLESCFSCDIHGGSLVFVVTKASIEEPPVILDKKYTITKISHFIYSIAKHVANISYHTTNPRYEKVYGYGAAAKAVSIINYASIKNLSAVFDDSDLKHGYNIPGTDIPIVPYSEELLNTNTLVVIFAWNFKKEILSKLPKGVPYLVVFPQVYVGIS